MSTNAIKLDAIARKVVMASMLYYGLDISIVTDEEYDKWCWRCGRLWHRLTSFRQWQLGSSKEIAATGFRVKVTMNAANAAVAWARPNGKVVIAREWKWSERRQCHWLYPAQFQLVVNKPARKRVRL